MTDEQLSFFQTLLTERARALLESADAELEELEGEHEDAEVLDPAEDTQTEFHLRLRDREKVLLVKLRAAMDRLQDGDYGLCAACGGDIAVKRLVTRPTAIHCIDCRSSETMLRPVGGW